MPPRFTIGDRVRLKVSRRHAEFRAGDTGTIAAVRPSARHRGTALYQIRMDRDAGAFQPFFYADELDLAPEQTGRWPIESPPC